MKRLFQAILALLLTAVPLLAQNGDDDGQASLRRRVEADNYTALTAYSAHPPVVAVHRVPRKDFYLWYSHLTDGIWGPDANWYPNETEVLYLSRTGTDGNKDIVWTRPVDDTQWSAPEPFCPEAVSPGNEVFPMLSPDGNRLYFASDGLFGIGGYDLYVATWDPGRKAWGNVQNLGLPFNSPADDLLFCDTPDGRYSLLASNRDCGRDSVDIYVLRQEVPVFRPAEPAEAKERLRLRVTDPDDGYLFVKRMPAPAPRLAFEASQEETDNTLRIGREGAFARDNRLPAGLVYQIQLFVSAKKPEIRQLKGISPVYAHPQRSGKTLYAAGLFRSYDEAEEALSGIRKAGFPSAFIIAFDEGRSVGLSAARKKESSVKVITEEVRIVK